MSTEVAVIFTDNIEMWISASVILVLLVIVFLLRRHQLKKNATLRLLNQCLRNFKQDEVTSIIIPDGIGGLIEVDRLILTEQGLLIIETYPLTGHLFGSEHIDQWTQIIDGRSYKFPNPSHHAQNVKHAVQMLAPKIPVYCRVVFTAEGDFPKGIPEGVSLLNSLEQDLQSMITTPRILEQVQVAWERILRIARKNGQAVMRDASL